MKTSNSKTNWALALAVAGTLASGFAMAEKGGGKGKDERADKGHGNSQGDKGRGNSQGDKGHGDKAARHDGGERASRDGGRREHFAERHRVVINDYYGQQYRSGRCPPGLAKKHNGCMPPGQARKWHMGQPLQVAYYSVPQSLIVQFGPPPSGHRYVRVGSDILLITINSRMIVDAVVDVRG